VGPKGIIAEIDLCLPCVLIGVIVSNTPFSNVDIVSCNQEFYPLVALINGIKIITDHHGLRVSAQDEKYRTYRYDQFRYRHEALGQWAKIVINRYNTRVLRDRMMK